MVETPYLLSMTRDALDSLLRVHRLDGVVVCCDRPPAIYRRLIQSRIPTEFPPLFVDAFSALGGFQTAEEDIVGIPHPFTLDNLEMAMDEALEQVAVRYEGQRHFILVDNLSTLKGLFPEKRIVRFFKEQGKRMAELDMFGIYMVPDGTMVVNWTDHLRRFRRS